MASRTESGARFQIFWTIAFSSLLHVSMDPSILIRRDVRITANRVAVKVTVPSGFNGMFIATKRCNTHTQCGVYACGLDWGGGERGYKK